MSLQRQQPILTTATQTPTTAIITRQSKHSRIALQHVRLAQDEGLNARGMTFKRCHEQGRPAVPAHAHITAPPNTQPYHSPSPRITSLQSKKPILTTATRTPATAAINRQSKHSLVALQHVRFAQDEGLNARGMTSKRCHKQGRLAVPAHAHITSPPNTHHLTTPSSRINVPSNTQPILTTPTQTPTTATITNHSKHSRGALQHVRFASNQRKDTIGVSV